MNKRYALFLGCNVPTRAKHYELSARKVAQLLGIEFIDYKDFLCCGFPMKNIDRETALLIAARELSIPPDKTEICTLCSACTGMLTEAVEQFKDENKRDSLNEKLKQIGREYRGNVTVRHFCRILYEDYGVEKIKKLVKVDLSSLKLAPHYGCHYLKPSELYNGFDDPETPVSIDLLIEATGAKSVNYLKKKQCCGGSVLAIDSNISYAIAGEKLENVKELEVDAICLICPFCALMYDDNQRLIERKFNKSFNIPVIYYPQLLGLALGMKPEELGFNMNKVKTSKILEKIFQLKV